MDFIPMPADPERQRALSEDSGPAGLRGGCGHAVARPPGRGIGAGSRPGSGPEVLERGGQDLPIGGEKQPVAVILGPKGERLTCA